MPSSASASTSQGVTVCHRFTRSPSLVACTATSRTHAPQTSSTEVPMAQLWIPGVPYKHLKTLCVVCAHLSVLLRRQILHGRVLRHDLDLPFRARGDFSAGRADQAVTFSVQSRPGSVKNFVRSFLPFSTGRKSSVESLQSQDPRWAEERADRQQRAIKHQQDKLTRRQSPGREDRSCI